MTYELWLRLRGPAGETVTQSTPPTFEAVSLKEALQILSEAEFPDNSLIRTVGLTLKMVSDEPVDNGPGFE